MSSTPVNDDNKPAPTKDEAAWRQNPPQVGPSPKVVIPLFEQSRLPSGLTVMVVRRPALPLVSMTLALKTGSAAESAASEYGLADLTFEMMMEGAGNRDGVALAEEFADLGTQMVVRTSEDGAAFKAVLLKKYLGAGMDLLSEILTRPTFKKSDFVRKQKERIADLQSLMGNPNYLSNIATATLVYGDTHPYGHPVMGTLKTVEAFGLKQLKAFYRQHAVPQNAALILTGDVSLDEAVALATEKLGSWKGGKNTPVKSADVKIAAGMGPFSIAIVPKPGMNQTIVSAGVKALPAGHPDEWALRVAVDAFGGMFGSRLNMNLREDKGYTYGARGHVDAMFLDGAVMLSTSVQADVTGAALGEILNELDNLKNRPVTAQEFQDATDNVLQSVSGWFDGVAGLGNAAQSIFERRLPLTRYSDMVAAYRQLTIEDVRHAVDLYMRRENFQVILVGDPAVITQQLSSLSLGAPQMINLQDN
ncbi:MAG: insulinase family protein [Deltaproteobacteria bacterium]|nr:insulinase family protein [Deltaproteobacteria bacterium]